jgi:hypothetical protein
VTAGYNLVTGLGTPVADVLVPDLVAYTYSTAVNTQRPVTVTGDGTSGGSGGSGVANGLHEAANVFDAEFVSAPGLGLGLNLGPRVPVVAGPTPTLSLQPSPASALAASSPAGADRIATDNSQGGPLPWGGNGWTALAPTAGAAGAADGRPTQGPGASPAPFSAAVAFVTVSPPALSSGGPLGASAGELVAPAALALPRPTVETVTPFSGLRTVTVPQGGLMSSFAVGSAPAGDQHFPGSGGLPPLIGEQGEGLAIGDQGWAVLLDGTGSAGEAGTGDKVSRARQPEPRDTDLALRSFLDEWTAAGGDPAAAAHADAGSDYLSGRPETDGSCVDAIDLYFEQLAD